MRPALVLLVAVPIALWAPTLRASPDDLAETEDPPRSPTLLCRMPGWLGEEAGLRGESGFVGWGGGLSTNLTPRTRHCWRVGGGLRLGWDSGRGVYAAAAARVSFAGTFYLQAGPGLSHERGFGLDAQLGIDAALAGVFVGAVWEQEGLSGYVGVRVAAIELAVLLLAALRR